MNVSLSGFCLTDITALVIQDFAGQQLVEQILKFALTAVTVSVDFPSGSDMSLSQSLFNGYLERRGAYARCYVSIWPYALLTHILLQIIAFIVGFVLQSLQATFAIFGASTLVLALVSPEIFLSTPALHSDVSHNFRTQLVILYLRW